MNRIQKHSSRKRQRFMYLVGVSLALLLVQNQSIAQTGPASSLTNAYDKPVMHPAIPLLDEQGKNVLQSGKVYSPKKSCEGGGCHDYEKITHAFHFEMGRDEADDNYGKKRGIPHLVAPGYFGGFNCMGGNTPTMLSKKNNSSANEFLDWGSVDFIKVCSSCHMGGGYEEKDRDGIRYDQKDEASIKPFDGDYYSVQNAVQAHGAMSGMTSFDTMIKRFDWKKSGVMEADCVTCHVGFNSFKKFPSSGLGKEDLSDKSSNALLQWSYLRDTLLVKNDFFREVPTSILEFVNLKPDDPQGQQLVTFERKNFKTTLTNGVGKDTYELVLDADGKPIVHWNPKAFDANGKVVFPFLRFTPPENCMNCHLTANSRRGFYGFGNEARMEQDEANGGTFKNDYRDDVHKGTTFTEANGETRAIENCNACHSKNYYNPPFKSPELSLDHNFLKGNSDMDLRNDLDYSPNAKSCAYCHQDIPDPVIPSGHKTLLSAHETLWKNNGDMAGYSQDSLTKITKTHLDVVSCEACHITKLEYAGKKMQVMYRYKRQEDGLAKISPYNPSFRYTWRDRKGDKVLSVANLRAVYKDAPVDASGKVTQGIIVNPMDGKELGRVGKTGAAYDFPKTYEQFMALKTAYDKLMEKRGFPGTDMQLVWSETNMYTMNHGTKPSPDSLQCVECHERKQSGAWSALVSPNSILGVKNQKVVGLPVPDKRLLDEGHIRFDQPYAKLDAKNQITINVEDILYSTKVDPFLSLLRNSSALTITGELKQKQLSSVLSDIKLVNDDLKQTIDKAFGGNNVFFFQNAHGNYELQNTAVVGFGGRIADAVLPQYRFTMDVYPDVPQHLVKTIESKVPGSKLASSVFWFHAKDQQNQTVSQFVTPVFVKMPYHGQASTPADIKILMSVDGKEIQQLDTKAILDVKPDNDLQQGYVIFSTTQFSWIAILDVKK